VVKEVTFSFSENGLVAFKKGESIGKTVLNLIIYSNDIK
jgi:hypothetical protein